MPLKNFEKEFIQPDGTPYLEPKASGKFNPDGAPLPNLNEDGTAKMDPVQFKAMIVNLLKNSISKESEKLSADEYIERWDLMRKVASSAEVEYSGKEIDMIRAMVIGAKLPPFIVGQLCSYLNEK